MEAAAHSSGLGQQGRHYAWRGIVVIGDNQLEEAAWQSAVHAAQRVMQTALPAGQVNIRLVNPAEITQLNQQYRGLRQSTDVLSFPAQEPQRPLARAELQAWREPLGDIAICLEAAQTQAQRNGHSLECELAALLVHGLLHLAGHDHADDEQQRSMDDMTRSICCEAGFEVGDFGH